MVRKRHLFLFWFLLSGAAVLAQKSSTPSKKQDTYKEYQSRSASVNSTQLLEEAELLKATDPAEALNRVREALAISIADKNRLTEAQCYLLIGSINEQINEWYLARENYQKAYRVLTTDHSATPEYGQSLLGLAMTSLELKEYPVALDYYLQARKIPTIDQTELFLQISEVYYQMGNYQEADRALDQIQSRKVSRISNTALIQSQRSKIQARLNEEPADDLYLNSLNTARSGEKVAPQTQQSLSETKEEIANVYRSQNRYDDEISLRNQAIEFNREVKNFSEVTKDKVEISRSLEAKGAPDEAILELEEAATISDSIDDPSARAGAYLALAQLYDKRGRVREAVDAFKRYSESVKEVDQLNEARYLMKERLLNKQQEIAELTTDVSLGATEYDLQEAVVFRQKIVIYGLLLIILIIGIASFFVFRGSQARQTANQLLALKSLRSQMNPHFIFNALNSVNHFISQQDERAANRFLSEFSQLMRLVLDNSQEDFISLKEEQEMLTLYLKLEHYRFRDKFDYEFKMDAEINSEEIALPPMLIQPYIENAVWHGLRYKESKGKLSVHFTRRPYEIEVTIEDDGIGRRRSAEIKTANQKRHNSAGLRNIEQRLDILNNVHKSNYRVSIHDLPGDSGTRVTIHLPIKLLVA